MVLIIDKDRATASGPCLPFTFRFTWSSTAHSLGSKIKRSDSCSSVLHMRGAARPSPRRNRRTVITRTPSPYPSTLLVTKPVPPGSSYATRDRDRGTWRAGAGTFTLVKIRSTHLGSLPCTEKLPRETLHLPFSNANL